MAETDFFASAHLTDEFGHGDAMVAFAPQRSLANIALYGGLKPLLDALGATLPLPGRQMRTEGVLYLWSGPASWLAICERDDPDFATGLANRLNSVAAVTDQSDGRTILRISGPASRDALAKLLPIDLHQTVFSLDETALTLAGHINVQIWRTGEDSFELACFRSFAACLFDSLREACQEFQIERSGRGC
jgi:sarcosine oxidase subunit gamma